MIEEIKLLLEVRDVEPFTVMTNGGSRYQVATADHASVGPKSLQMHIWFDDGGGVTVSVRNIAAIEKPVMDHGQAA